MVNTKFKIQNLIFKIFTIFTIAIILLLCMEKKSYGTIWKSAIGDSAFKLAYYELKYDGTTDVSTDSIESELEKYYGYTGEFATTMKFETTVTIYNKNSDGTYQVRVGNNPEPLEKDFKFKKGLQKKWGYEGDEDDIITETDLEESGADGNATSWDVILIVSCSQNYLDYSTDTISGYGINYYTIKIQRIYSGDDIVDEDGNDGEGRTIEVSGNSLHLEIEANKTKSEIQTFAENFSHNAGGTIWTIILDALRTVFGDAPQRLIDWVQNSTLHISTQLMYSYEEFEDGDVINDYTNVGDYVDDDSDVKEGQYGIEVDSTYYDSDTKIPVITAEIYNYAVGNINFLDINFLNGDDSHEQGSPWMIIRNIFVAIIRATLYVSTAALITTLIWHGVNIVLISLHDNPEKLQEHKNGLNNFVKSIGMLIGTILIMSICIFGSEAICKVITTGAVESDSSYEQPIRVHVKNADYSFSTNVTGYVRYMSEITDVDACGKKTLYTIVYIILVWLNLLGLGFMLIRLFGVYILAICGPIIAVFYMFRQEALLPMNYSTWALLYAALCLANILFAFAYKLATLGF